MVNSIKKTSVKRVNMFKDKLMVGKENKKLILGVLLTFIVCMGSAILAAYSTGPEFDYPNPGHQANEIGPGTFNASGESNPYWSFPADELGNIAFLINGTGFFYEGLRIVGNPFPGPDFLVEGDTQLGDDSSDKTTVKGDLNVSGNARITGLTNCDTIDTDASGNLVCGTDASGGGTGVVDPTVDCTTECYNSVYTNSIFVNGSGCAGIGIDCSLQCYNSTYTNSGCTAGSGCSGLGTDCSLQCYNSTHEKRCTAGSGCSGLGTDCTLQCYDSTHIYSGCTDGSGCSGSGTACEYNCISEEGCGSVCECDGIGYKNRTLNGDTVYVDCSADKCWTPTAGSTYQWGTGTNGEDCTPSSCIGNGSVCPACNYCDNLDYGGFSNWVLPDKTTLQNLCNSGSCSGTCFGGDGSAGFYWSSTELDSGYTYEVYFTNCNLLRLDKDASRFVRCVRG